jgi:hypothetical protein
MFLRLIQRQRGHCREQNQGKITIKKSSRSLLIFSAHITTNAIEIVFSAPLEMHAIIRSREYFLCTRSGVVTHLRRTARLMAHR